MSTWKNDVKGKNLDFLYSQSHQEVALMIHRRILGYHLMVRAPNNSKKKNIHCALILSKK